MTPNLRADQKLFTFASSLALSDQCLFGTEQSNRSVTCDIVTKDGTLRYDFVFQNGAEALIRKKLITWGGYYLLLIH